MLFSPFGKISFPHVCVTPSQFLLTLQIAVKLSLPVEPLINALDKL